MSNSILNPLPPHTFWPHIGGVCVAYYQKISETEDAALTLLHAVLR